MLDLGAILAFLQLDFVRQSPFLCVAIAQFAALSLTHGIYPLHDLVFVFFPLLSTQLTPITVHLLQNVHT